MFNRILVLPFYYIALVVVVGAPFLLASVVYEGGVQNLLGALVILGIYPLFLTMLHTARIEQFIARTLRQKKIAGEYASAVYRSDINFLFAHHRLLRLLHDEWWSGTDRLVHDKGLALARRHRLLASMSWWGMGIAGIAIACFEYLAE